MEPYAPSVLLLLVSLIFGADGDTLLPNHLEELLSLSELPLEKLLYVKRTFVDPPLEGRFVILRAYWLLTDSAPWS
jgi:hypothetical protein